MSIDGLKSKMKLYENRALTCGILVIAGLTIEVVLAFKTALTIKLPYGEQLLESFGPLVADMLVTLGVFGEIFFARRAAAISGELQRRSDEKVAEAEKNAEQARERTAEIERITAWRSIEPDSRDKIINAFKGKIALLRLAIEYQNGDPEAWSLARAFAELFTTLGLEKNNLPEQFTYRSNCIWGVG